MEWQVVALILLVIGGVLIIVLSTNLLQGAPKFISAGMTEMKKVFCCDFLGCKEYWGVKSWCWVACSGVC